MIVRSSFYWKLRVDLTGGPCDSTVAVALWALQDLEVHPTLELALDSVVEGGVGLFLTNNPGWSPRW